MSYPASYSGLYPGPTMSVKTAHYIVVEDHRVSWDDFLTDLGVRTSYNTRNVFAWLGY